MFFLRILDIEILRTLFSATSNATQRSAHQAAERNAERCESSQVVCVGGKLQAENRKVPQRGAVGAASRGLPRGSNFGHISMRAASGESSNSSCNFQSSNDPRITREFTMNKT